MLLPVRWENDWPIFNEGNPVTLQMQGPNTYVFEEEKKWKDNFTSDELGLGWYRKSTHTLYYIQFVTNAPQTRL